MNKIKNTQEVGPIDIKDNSFITVGYYNDGTHMKKYKYKTLEEVTRQHGAFIRLYNKLCKSQTLN